MCRWTGAELELPGEVTYFKGTSSAKEGDGKITLETNKESRILDHQTAGEMHILIIPIQILLNYFQYLDFKNNVLPLQLPQSTILIKANSQMTTWAYQHQSIHTKNPKRIRHRTGDGRVESNFRFCLAERTVPSMNIYLSIYKLRVDSNKKKFAFLQFDIEQYSE